jgi:hypothetical protein
MLWLLVGFQPFLRAIRRGAGDPEFRALATLVLLLLFVGTAFYHQAEGWSFVDSFYFSSVTLATVGYGDLHPTTDVAKIFTVFYIFTGIGVLVAFVERMARNLIEVRAEQISARQQRRAQHAHAASEQQTQSRSEQHADDA